MKDELDRDRPPITILENAIFDADVSIYALAVFTVLCMHADKKSKKCWPGYTRIAGYAKCSRSKAIEAVQELAKKGFISIRARRKGSVRLTNIYTINSAYIYVPKHDKSKEKTETPSTQHDHPSTQHDPNYSIELSHKDKKERKEPDSFLLRPLEDRKSTRTLQEKLKEAGQLYPRYLAYVLKLADGNTGIFYNMLSEGKYWKDWEAEACNPAYRPYKPNPMLKILRAG